MKTTGLTLQEALQALVEGKAKRASHPNSAAYLIFDREKNRFAWEGIHIGFTLASGQLTPKWSLIDPVQVYEDVEVVRWVVVNNDGSILSAGFETESEAVKLIPCCPDGSRIVKMTGVDRVPKKEKVTHWVEVEGSVDSAGDGLGTESIYPFEGRTETYNKTGKLIFEWEE